MKIFWGFNLAFNISMEQKWITKYLNGFSRDILLQKRVSLSHTPDIVRIFQKATQAQEQHEFQKVRHQHFFWRFLQYSFYSNSAKFWIMNFFSHHGYKYLKRDSSGFLASFLYFGLITHIRNQQTLRHTYRRVALVQILSFSSMKNLL